MAQEEFVVIGDLKSEKGISHFRAPFRQGLTC
jgi:hypothetical protein